MITIRKDNVEMKVTSGCYENLYKRMGYEIVSEKTVKKVEKVVEPEKVSTPEPTEPIKEEPKKEGSKSFKKEDKNVTKDK